MILIRFDFDSILAWFRTSKAPCSRATRLGTRRASRGRQLRRRARQRTAASKLEGRASEVGRSVTDDVCPPRAERGSLLGAY